MDFTTKKLIENLNIAPQEIVNIIHSHGVPTGSQVFGGWSKETSDVDWLLSPKSPIRIYDIPEKYGFCPGLYVGESNYSVMYIRPKEGRIYNLFFFKDPIEYRVWVDATSALKTLVGNHTQIAETVRTNKERRIAIFRELKNCFRGAVQ